VKTLIRRLKPLWPIGLLILITLAYYYPVWLKGLVPFPGDLLVGAYYPWLDYKWGWLVGVPIKNPLVSDVFSQIYLWKTLVADAYRHWTWPLWNPYSYSGYPLLANFHSGALYPFNALFLLLGNINGWSTYIIWGTLGSLITMYLFLRTLRYSTAPALIGAVSYSFSGFAVIWSQFAAGSQTLIWIPAIFTLIEKYFQTKNSLYLMLISPVTFLLITGGHFQTIVYSLVFIIGYFLWKLVSTKSIKFTQSILYFTGGWLLGLALAAPQLLPSLEMASLSIRFQEPYIIQYHYGLLPLQNLITLWAPDYFGNPTTGNYWGFYNYQETVLYVGIVGLFSLIYALYQKSRSRETTFFLAAALLALLLSLDTPAGQLIYFLRVPGLSTGAAGRISVLLALSGSVLVANFLTHVKHRSYSTIIRQFWGPITGILVIGLLTLASQLYLNSLPPDTSALIHLQVALRNLVLPVILTIGLLTLLILRKWKIFPLLIAGLLLFDLFRFAYKYTPFTPKDYLFPSTEVLTWLQSQPGIFRVDRERGEVLPPNTWTAYGLMSPSGYDPMALNRYTLSYQTRLNSSPSPSVSRYAELSHFPAQQLGQFNVKYLLTLKRDSQGQVPGNLLNPQIDLTQWQPVYQAGNTVVLENLLYQNRARLVDSAGQPIESSNVTITDYSPQSVTLNYHTPVTATLVLADTWYPGWQAWVNHQPTPITPWQDIFRSLPVPPGDGQVQFAYHPPSFTYGLKLSLISLVLWLVLIVTTLTIKIPSHPTHTPRV
jgi:hypothetical protein